MPNVKWDDVGGLEEVKRYDDVTYDVTYSYDSYDDVTYSYDCFRSEILDTVQLPYSYDIFI